MKKSTLIFGLVFAVLLSYVLLVEKKNFSKLEPPSRQGPRLFAAVKQADFNYFKIQNGPAVIAFRKNDSGQWMMQKPLADIADNIQCENLARSLAGLTLLGKIEKKEKPNEYGFNKVSIRLHAEGKNIAPIDMEFGDEDPTDKGIYAYLPSDQKIALIPNFIKQIANEPIAEWRDPAPVHLDQDKIVKATFTAPNGTVSFYKKKDVWFMSKPAAEDADADKVQQFLVAFLSIRGMHFVPIAEEKKLAPFGALTLTEAKTTRVISFKKKGSDFIIFPPGRAYGVVAGSPFLKEISFNPAHYFDRHLIRFNDRLIADVRIVKKDKLFVFKKNGSDWNLLEPQKTRIPPWKAVSILSDLREIKMDKKAPAPSSFHAVASIKLAEENRPVGTVYIGGRMKIGKKDFYPARVEPSDKTGMIDAGPLFRDLP